MNVHWGVYVVLVLFAFILWRFLRAGDEKTKEECWVLESFPRDGNWHNASHIYHLVRERHPEVTRSYVNGTLEGLQKKGVLESRITDESYATTQQPVRDPFGQWRFIEH